MVSAQLIQAKQHVLSRWLPKELEQDVKVLKRSNIVLDITLHNHVNGDMMDPRWMTTTWLSIVKKTSFELKVQYGGEEG